MEFDLVAIFEKMSAFALVIVAALLAMAVASVSVVLERLWSFRRYHLQSLELAKRIEPLIQRGAWGEVSKAAAQTRPTPFSRMVIGVANVHADAGRGAPAHLAERVQNEAARRLENAEADLRRGMGVLASVGSVAPFVGLLGTVIGIINAFEGIAADNASGIGSVAAGIAEALVVTAIGLAVAIPAVLLFNYLNGRVDAMMLVLKTAAGEMTDAMTLATHGDPIREEAPSRVPPILAPLKAAVENQLCG